MRKILIFPEHINSEWRSLGGLNESSPDSEVYRDFRRQSNEL